LQLKLALAKEDTEAARQLLTTLQEMVPGGMELLPLEAELEEARGRSPEALALLRAAVKQSPSWRNFHHLATLEFRTGRASDARAHLEEARRRWPSNTWVELALASGELLYGEAKRAEERYRELLAGGDAGVYTNLGLSLFLQGEYEEAIEAYQQALTEESENPDVLLNLADAEFELGRTKAALSSYRRVRALLEESDLTSAEGQLALAQCLARLGMDRPAVKIAREALKEKPDDPFVSYTASMVHALAKERDSAVFAGIDALKAGLAEHWFRIPAMKPVWDDEDFKAALAERRRPGEKPLDPAHPP